MSTKNPCNVSSVQLDFNNPAGSNYGLSTAPATSIYPSPIRADPPSSESVAKIQEMPHHLSTDSREMPSETASIFDYMIWSAINVAVGGIVLGIPPLILSIFTRRFKRKGNAKIAKKLSVITLTLNIIVSFIAMVGLVYIITHFNNPY
jgi:hypothetical protein